MRAWAGSLTRERGGVRVGIWRPGPKQRISFVIHPQRLMLLRQFRRDSGRRLPAAERNRMGQRANLLLEETGGGWYRLSDLGQAVLAYAQRERLDDSA